MPQFDLVVYFTFFLTFLVYSFILYIFLSVYIIPLFWNIYYFRYLKKETNNLLVDLYVIRSFYLNKLFIHKTNNTFIRFTWTMFLSNKVLSQQFLLFNFYYNVFASNSNFETFLCENYTSKDIIKIDIADLTK